MSQRPRIPAAAQRIQMAQATRLQQAPRIGAEQWSNGANFVGAASNLIWSDKECYNCIFLGQKMRAAIETIVSMSLGVGTGKFPSNASANRALTELEESRAYLVIGSHSQMKYDWAVAREKLTNQAGHTEAEVETAAKTILALLEKSLVVQGIGPLSSGGGDGGSKKSPFKLRQVAIN